MHRLLGWVVFSYIISRVYKRYNNVIHDKIRLQFVSVMKVENDKQKNEIPTT